jgi:hypothetical protein
MTATTIDIGKMTAKDRLVLYDRLVDSLAPNFSTKLSLLMSPPTSSSGNAGKKPNSKSNWHGWRIGGW